MGSNGAGGQRPVNALSMACQWPLHGLTSHLTHRHTTALWPRMAPAPHPHAYCFGPLMAEPFTLSSSKGRPGFDKPVLSTVEGLSPNGM